MVNSGSHDHDPENKEGEINLLGKTFQSHQTFKDRFQCRVQCLGVLHIITIQKKKNVVVLTVNKHNGLLDGMLVTKLRIEQRSADKGAIVSGLVPAHVQMVNVDVTQ